MDEIPGYKTDKEYFEMDWDGRRRDRERNTSVNKRR